MFSLQKRGNSLGDRIRSYFFLILLMIFPLVDIFNGVFITYGHEVPLGIAYRLLFICFILYSVLLQGIRRSGIFFLLLLSLVSLILVCVIQSFYFRTGIPALIKELSYIIRFSLCLLIPFFAEQYQEQFSLKKMAWLTIVLDSFLVGGLVIPYLLGIGNNTYDETAGFKGFYFATNDIAYAFLILLFLIGWFLIRREKPFPTIVLLVLYFSNLYCLVILGTKSGLLAGVLYSLYLVIYFISHYRSRTLYEQFFVFEFLLLLFLLLVVKGKEFILKSLSSVITRFVYFKTLYQDDWLRLLLSSRNVYLRDANEQFLQTPNNQAIFWFGSGFENRWDWYGRKGGLIEMDFFDMFFSYGMIGLVVLVLVVSYFWFIILNKGTSKFGLFLLLFTIIYSFLVGHVFFSALSATVFGVMAMFIQEIKKEQLG
ncbi:hypothetical protein IGI46_000112 [Enterococcus sp. AZ163]